MSARRAGPESTYHRKQAQRARPGRHSASAVALEPAPCYRGWRAGHGLRMEAAASAVSANTCLSLSSRQPAREPARARLFCAGNSVGLLECTETPTQWFSVRIARVLEPEPAPNEPVAAQKALCGWAGAAQKRAFGLGRTRRIGASARPGALHRAWAVRHGRRLASRRQGAGRYFLPSKSGCAPAPAPGRLPEPVLVVSFPPPGSETYQLGVCYLIFQPTCGGGVSSWSTRT
jgi:hypothetical protein